jgi:hypothetical protein
VWNLKIHPKGTGRGISFYLKLAEDELTKFAGIWKVKAEYKLRIRNQRNTNHVELEVKDIFCNSLFWGCAPNNLMPPSDVNDKSKGFLMNDSLVVEVEFTKVEKLPTSK